MFTTSLADRVGDLEEPEDSDLKDFTKSIFATVRDCDWSSCDAILVCYEAILTTKQDSTWLNDLINKLLVIAVRLRPDLVNQPDAVTAQINIIKALLSCSGQIYNCVLEHALLYGSVETVKLLLAAGCEITLSSLKLLLQYLLNLLNSAEDISRDQAVVKFNLLINHCDIELGWVFLSQECLHEYDYKTGIITSGSIFRTNLFHLDNPVVTRAVALQGLDLSYDRKSEEYLVRLVKAFSYPNTTRLLVKLGLINQERLSSTRLREIAELAG